MNAQFFDTWQFWMQAFYYFPVARIVQHTFFDNPEWVALRGRDRDRDLHDPSTYMGSADAKRINALPQYAGKLLDGNSGLLEIGYDHLQCFNFVNYSIGMVNIRQGYSDDANSCLTHCMPSHHCLTVVQICPAP